MTTTNPPDSYHVDDLANITWGTEIDSKQTGTELGGNLVEFLAVAASVDPLMETDFFPVERLVRHNVSACVKASANAGGDNVQLFLDLYDVAKVFARTVTIHNAPLVQIVNFEIVGASPLLTGAELFGKIRFGKTASAGFSVEFDRVQLTVYPTSVDKGATTILTSAATGAWTTITNFSGDQNRVTMAIPGSLATIKEPGLYWCGGGVTVLGLATGEHVRTRIIINGLQAFMGNTVEKAATFDPCSTVGSHIRLLPGDTIGIQVWHDSAAARSTSIVFGETYMDIHIVNDK